MKYLLLFFLCLPALAEFDLSVGSQGRSYPGVGAEAYLQGGYNLPIWGTIEKGKIGYGMLRAQTRMASSVVVSNIDNSLTFYPISFIGLGAGRKEMTSNFKEFAFYDCEEVRCEGKLNKDYLFGKIAMGFGPLLTSYIYTESRISYDDPDGTNLPVGEYEFVSIVNPGNETTINQFSFVGVKMLGGLVGAVSRKVFFQESEQEFNNHILFYNWRADNWNIMLGGGNLYSSHIKPGPTAFFRINYSIKENKGLF